MKDVHLFVQIAQARHLSHAADTLGMTPAAVSAALRRFEAHCGLKLVQRTTRHFKLTAEGEEFLRHCTQALQAMDGQRQRLLQGREQLQGQVRISMPSDLGRNVLLPILRQFRQMHPQVRLRIELEDRMASLHSEAVDVVLRYGTPRNSSLVMLPICADNRRVLVAAPAYLARHGIPTQPQQLPEHECLCFLLAGKVHRLWQFTLEGQTQRVRVKDNIISNDGEAIRQLALAGEGIAYKAQLDVAADLNTGRLVALCSHWQGEHAPLFMGCADRSQWHPIVHRLRTFLITGLHRLQNDASPFFSGHQERSNF